MEKKDMTFVEKSVITFNQYYPMISERTKTKTLIIPTSNDLVAKYFYGKIDPNDHPSNYDANCLKEERKRMKKEHRKYESDGKRLLKTARNEGENENAEKLIAKANAIKAELDRSNQPWNKLANIAKNREKETTAKLIGAFRNADIGGVLILAPTVTNELKDFIGNQCGKEPIFTNFQKELKQYQEICDCIFIHPILGIYTIEVKSIKELKPMQTEIERNRMTKKEIDNNPYEKSVNQLSRVLISKNGTMTLLQKLYLLITESKDFPQMSGIICTPNAESSEVAYWIDKRFDHFDSNLLSSKEKFKQFWINELSNCKTEVPFDFSHYHKFIATMANCSVGRELFGINNSLMIAKKITEQNIDPTMMTKRQYISSEGSQTIFLNAKQMQILNDTSKLKFIFGPPGTGKTLLVILAAIDAVKKENGKVIVFTREWLVEYMKRIFKMNQFDQNTIEVRDFVAGYGELNENNYIFVDECSANESNAQNLLNIAEQIRNGKLFVAITGQGGIDKLCSIEEQIMQLLKNENDYRIFQLTEILRGTKSIIHFWINRLNQILPKELQMECGHSIVGENVDYYDQYIKSGKIMEKIEERLKELLKNNEPKNIVIICRGSYEKLIIESRLKLIKIAFGSTIEQDNNHSLIAVEFYDNTYSREWPFVIYVDLFPYYSQRFSIISSSRAIAHLTFIERNVKEIRKIIRNKCDDNMIKTILSSFNEYTQFRYQIELFDNLFILYDDLSIDIISLNYFPSQIKQLYPNIFDDCNTFDQFFDRIVNKEQWMLLLFVHQLEYFQDSRHVDKSIGLIIEYKQSRTWIELYEIEEMRAECLINNAKIAIELINKLIQPQFEEMMDKVAIDNWQLFEVFNNSNGIHQFDLMAWSIQKIIRINCSQVHTSRKVEIDKNEINNNIAKLLQNLRLLGYKWTTTDL